MEEKQYKVKDIIDKRVNTNNEKFLRNKNNLLGN